MDSNTHSPIGGADTRRDFLKKTATAAAVVASASVLKTPVYGQNQAPSPGRVIGANDRIVVAHIGVGEQGQAHVRSVHSHAGDNNVVQAAVCDVSKTRLDQAKKIIGRPDVAGFDDHRKLLERKDIDVVVVATVDHWHAPISIDALEAGKHVYVEKPMTRYLGEAFHVLDTARRTGKLVQLGAQAATEGKYHKVAELIRAGKLGPLVLGQHSYMRNSPKGEWNTYELYDWVTPDDIDWKRWMGQVHDKVPFNAHHYRRWRKFYPYCAGVLGDLVPHRLLPLLLATGNPEFPSRVVCIGNKKFHTDRNMPGALDRDVNENTQLLAEFPSGYSVMVTSSTVNEQGLEPMIRGHHASVYFGGNRVALKPERPFADDVDPEDYQNLQPGEEIGAHEKNLFDCIRTNKAPNANVELGARVQTIISLAEMSERLNICCLFDEKTRKITTGDGREVEPITYGTLPLS